MPILKPFWRRLVSYLKPFAFALKFKWANQGWGWNHLANGRCRGPHHKNLRKAEEANFKAMFTFFTILSTAEAHGFRVKFIGLYGTVGFIAIRDFSLRGESDLWSDFWPVMDGVVCLSILLGGGVTVSNNFTKQRQNGFKNRHKTQVHDTFEVGKLYFKWNSYLHNFFLPSVIFPYNSLYTQACILSLGSLWTNGLLTDQLTFD